VTRRGSLLTGAAALAAAAIVMARPTAAQLLVSANDRKVVLVDGVQTVVPNAPPDTVTVIDLDASPPRAATEIAAPVSVIGPPSSVAVTPDGTLALVTAAMKVDPANPSQLAPDNRITVIDLAARPAAVIRTLTAGPGPSGIAVNRAGTLALVANRGDGTISVFSIAGRDITPAGTVDLAAPGSIPSAIAFSADGRRAFVTRNGDSLISVLAIDGTRVAYTKTDFGAGFRPYPLEVTPAGNLAVVGHVGAGASGGEDLLSLIDLTPALPRAIAHVAAGPTVEGLAISPDGRHVAATVMNGTQFPKASPNVNDFGRLRIFRIEPRALVPAAEAPIGHWCQGVAWSRDGRRVVAQCPVERELQLFAFDGRALTPAGAIGVSGGPVGIRTQP
jgi:DNA-binding beta-propeller fold protein YncE